MARIGSAHKRKAHAPSTQDRLDPALGRSRAAAILTQDLIAQIRSGALPPGGLIVSGPELSKRYGISYQTVVRALSELVERGWLVRQHGRGTYVAPYPPKEEGEATSSPQTVLVALDPRSLARGRFGFAIVEALDESLVHAGLRVRYAPLSAAGEAALLEEFAAGRGEVALLIAFDRPAFLASALERCPGLPALALHALPEHGGWMSGSRFDAVLVEDRLGGFLAGALLLRYGHRRIAILSGPQNDSRAQDRAQGLREALARENLKPLAEGWAEGWDERAGFQAATALLGKLDCKGHSDSVAPEPWAVFCANDRLACGFYQAASGMGLVVPDEVSVVGFDDQELAAQLEPPLTSLRIDRAEYGRQAALLVQERLAEPNRPPRMVRMPVAVVERQSVRHLTRIS